MKLLIAFLKVQKWRNYDLVIKILKFNNKIAYKKLLFIYIEYINFHLIYFINSDNYSS